MSAMLQPANAAVWTVTARDAPDDNGHPGPDQTDPDQTEDAAGCRRVAADAADQVGVLGLVLDVACDDYDHQGTPRYRWEVHVPEGTPSGKPHDEACEPLRAHVQWLQRSYPSALEWEVEFDLDRPVDQALRDSLLDSYALLVRPIEEAVLPLRAQQALSSAPWVNLWFPEVWFPEEWDGGRYCGTYRIPLWEEPKTGLVETLTVGLELPPDIASGYGYPGEDETPLLPSGIPEGTPLRFAAQLRTQERTTSWVDVSVLSLASTLARNLPRLRPEGAGAAKAA